jgi:hypothetical protein
VQRLNAVVPGRWRQQFQPVAAELVPGATRRIYLACRLAVTLPRLQRPLRTGPLLGVRRSEGWKCSARYCDTWVRGGDLQAEAGCRAQTAPPGNGVLGPCGAEAVSGRPT